MRALLTGAQEDRELAHRLDGFLSGEPFRATIDRIEQASGLGEVDPSVDPAVFAELVFGAVFRRWLLGTGELDSEFADAVAAMAIRATAPL